MTNDIKKLIDFFQSGNEIEAKKKAVNLLKKIRVKKLYITFMAVFFSKRVITIKR